MNVRISTASLRPAPIVAGLSITVGLLGCGHAADGQSVARAETPRHGETLAAKSTKPEDPAAALREQLHAGAYQANGALDDLNDALEAIRSLPDQNTGETKEALLNLIDTLDSAGRELSDHTGAPDIEEVRKDIEGTKDLREKALTDVSASLMAIREVQSTLDDMIDSGPPPPMKSALQKASEAIDDATASAGEAIKLLGGKIPPEAPKKEIPPPTNPLTP